MVFPFVTSDKNLIRALEAHSHFKRNNMSGKKTANQKKVKEFEFTEQELQIAKMFATGSSTAQVAKKLKLSDRTIENKILEMRQVTKTKNKTHLIVFMVTDGYVDLAS